MSDGMIRKIFSLPKACSGWLVMLLSPSSSVLVNFFMSTKPGETWGYGVFVLLMICPKLTWVLRQ